MRIRNTSELDPATTIIPPIDGQHRMPGNPADRATMMQALPPDGAHPPSGDASAATGCGLDGSEELANSRSEEHTSELQSQMRISYAVFCLNIKKLQRTEKNNIHHHR